MKEKSKLTRNIERYLVDYIKQLLKAKHINAETKFKSMLLLKDLMNNTHRVLIDYTEKKILRRLYDFARSEFKENVLLQTNPATDPKISADFYHLVLECLDSWGNKYGETNHAYYEKRYKLVTENKLPIKPFFANIPGFDEEFVYNDISNFNEDDIETLLDDIKTVREKITLKLLQDNTTSFKSRELDQLITFYKDVYQKLDHHPEKKAFLNDGDSNPRLEELKDDLLNELIYYQTFADIYQKAIDAESNCHFYIELKNINKNFFDKSINIEPCLMPEIKNNYVYEPEELNNDDGSVDSKVQNQPIFNKQDKKERTKLTVRPDNKKRKRDKSEENVNYNYEGLKDDNNSYDFNDEALNSIPVHKKQPVKVKMERKQNHKYQKLDMIRNVDKENQDLNVAISKLESQKRALAIKVQNLESEKNVRRTITKSNSVVSIPLRDKTYVNEGLLNIMKSKEDQIKTLQEKIKKIEDEHIKINSHDEEFISIRQTSQLDFRNKYRSRLNLNITPHRGESNDLKCTIRRMPKNDNSGTEFVNQLYTNINKLLNKPKGRQLIKEMGNAY